jgi:hypothetical protein
VSELSRVRVAGPLESYADGFADQPCCLDLAVDKTQASRDRAVGEKALLMTLTMFPLPPKVHTQPTQEGSYQESSYGDQHLWLGLQPATSTLKEQSSHGNGSPNPHVGEQCTHHDEDCSHYPSDHERR